MGMNFDPVKHVKKTFSRAGYACKMNFDALAKRHMFRVVLTSRVQGIVRKYVTSRKWIKIHLVCISDTWKGSLRIHYMVLDQSSYLRVRFIRYLMNSYHFSFSGIRRGKARFLQAEYHFLPDWRWYRRIFDFPQGPMRKTWYWRRVLILLIT